MSNDFHLYNALYLRRAADVLAAMLDYAVYSLHYTASSFLGLFIASGAADEFETGDPGMLLGRSGAELACMVLDRCGLDYEQVRPRFTRNLSKEYLCGRALAICQWEYAESFRYIAEALSFDELLDACESYRKEEKQRLAGIWPPPEETARDKAERDARCVDHLCSLIASALGGAGGDAAGYAGTGADEKDEGAAVAKAMVMAEKTAGTALAEANGKGRAERAAAARAEDVQNAKGKAGEAEGTGASKANGKSRAERAAAARSAEDVPDAEALTKAGKAAGTALAEANGKGRTERAAARSAVDVPDAEALTKAGKAAGTALAEANGKSRVERAAARLREARAASRLSQSRLAAASGVPLRTIQQYEQGQKALDRASWGTVRRLAAALGCRIEDLI